MALANPGVLQRQEPFDLVRRRSLDEPGDVDAGCFEVVEDRAAGQLVMGLLDEVALQVVSQTRCNLVGWSELARPQERRLHQLQHRARDVVPRGEVRGIELANLRVLEQAPRRQREVWPDELDL